MATAGPPHAALLARGRPGAHTGGQNSPQDMYGGLGRGGAANGRALRTLRGDDLQVRPGGAFDPIGDPSVAACAHGASTQRGPGAPYARVWRGGRRPRVPWPGHDRWLREGAAIRPKTVVIHPVSLAPTHPQAGGGGGRHSGSAQRPSVTKQSLEISAKNH